MVWDTIWALGLLPAAAMAALAFVLHLVAKRSLRKRCPDVRPGQLRAARGPTTYWCIAGISFCLIVLLLSIFVTGSSTAGIGVCFVLVVMAVVSPVWRLQLLALAGVARVLSHEAMHMTLFLGVGSGTLAAVCTPIVVTELAEAGMLADDGAAFPLVLGTLPLGTALGGLLVAALAAGGGLPIDGNGPKCPECGYDLSGLPASASSEGGIRCPECGYHATQAPSTPS